MDGRPGFSVILTEGRNDAAKIIHTQAVKRLLFLFSQLLNVFHYCNQRTVNVRLIEEVKYNWNIIHLAFGFQNVYLRAVCIGLGEISAFSIMDRWTDSPIPYCTLCLPIHIHSYIHVTLRAILGGSVSCQRTLIIGHLSTHISSISFHTS